MTMSALRGLLGRVQAFAAVLAGLAFMTAGWSKGREPAKQVPSDSAIGPALGTLGQPKDPAPPKVPFGDQPCQSLSSADETTLKMFTPVHGQAERAPGTLPFDNVCTYVHAGTRQAQVGYMTKG